MPGLNPIKRCGGCNDAAVRALLAFAQQCSACRKKERNRLWRIANPGVLAVNAKRWREAGNVSVRPEGYAEQQRLRKAAKYRSDPAVREQAKAGSLRWKEKVGQAYLNKLSKEWRDAHPGKTREYYLRGVARLDPEQRKEKGKQHREVYRFQRQAGSAAYYARRWGGDGVISNEHLVGLHKWQDHCCFYCRRPLDSKDTIEHIVPLSRGGSNNPWNVSLSCGECNSSKNDRIYGIEWQPSLVLPAPRWHSIEGLRRLKQTLTAEGIAYDDRASHLFIKDRPVFVLSSFWLGWQGDASIKALKEQHPSSILFFDKEYVRRPEAVINVLKAKAGIAQRTGARKLQLVIPTSQEAQAFISRWHAMGGAGATHYLGLRDDQDWWAIGAFRKETDRYEVIRMAIRETVAGGVSRILSHFRATMPEKLPIVAFTDQRMGDGKSHFFAGFELDGMTDHSFFYATSEMDGFHPRRDFQKQVLEAKAEYFDPALTQVVNAKANGLMRVEGLPRLRFVLQP